MILNSVVSATLKDFRDLGPLVAIVTMHQVQDPFFFFAPSNLLDLRVEVIMPTLTALLANASREMLCNQSPLLRPILVNQVKNHTVLILSPRAFDKAWIENLLPSVKTLDISSAGKLFSNFLPIFASMLLYCICQMLILYQSQSPLSFPEIY